MSMLPGFCFLLLESLSTDMETDWGYPEMAGNFPKSNEPIIFGKVQAEQPTGEPNEIWCRFGKSK